VFVAKATLLPALAVDPWVALVATAMAMAMAMATMAAVGQPRSARNMVKAAK